METETQLAFTGTAEEKKIASHAFDAMKRKGILFGANAPIRMSVEAIAKVLTKEGGPLAGSKPDQLMPKIDAALSKNQAIFARTANGEFATTKSGHAYQEGAGQNTHTFKERLNTHATNLDPEAAKEYAESLVTRAAERADKSSVMDTVVESRSMASFMPPIQHTPHITFDNTTVIPQHLIPPPPPVEAPPEPEEVKAPAPQPHPRTSAEPPAAAATAVPAPVAPASVPAPATTTSARPAQPAPTTKEEGAPASRVESTPVPGRTAASDAALVSPAPQPQAQGAQAASSAAAAAAPAPAVKPAPPKEPSAPVITGPVEMRVTTPDGPVTIDLRNSVDEIFGDTAVASALAGLINAAVEEDSRLVRFGSDIFPEEAIDRFSKGDFRRIKDFLDEPETGGVASDNDFMSYVLNRRPEQPDYDRLRFALNYRLLKEKKDFEFVGIDSNRLWMNAGAVPVAPPKRKPAEIGQDYRFLEDPAISWAEEEETQTAEESQVGPLEFSLTYYEYENGVLPYDMKAKRAFRGPVFDDQRASLIQFEIPQLYTSLLVELRYPTGNRGGFIMGLGDFFAEHMVPGAKFTVVPTDRAENIFELHFTRENEREENLLQFDDRKSRYVFRPVSFAVATDPSMLLEQEKFGKLHNEKKLDEAERKRPDVILANAFEVVGEVTDGVYWAILDDIYPVVNLERPISRSWLKTLLSGAYPFFYADETTEGAYFYDPSKKPS